MSEFKIPPYLYWYPSDWLNDPEVRRLPPDVKGFYIDLICQLHFAFPYGYCSLLNHKKTSKLQNQVNQTSNQEVNLRVELLLSLSVNDQLKLAENIEKELHLYIPYNLEQIQGYIRVLEDRTILSRGPSGIIYSRRMVKDFKKRVTAYLNGSKGGNPGIKLRKKTKKPEQKLVDKLLKGKGLRKRVNQKSNQVAYPNADLHNNNIIVGKEGVRAAGKNPVFLLQELYDKNFSDLVQIGYQKKKIEDGRFTEEGFQQWKKFVDWIIEFGYSEIFALKFVKPDDFEDLWRNKNFVHTPTNNPKFPGGDPEKDIWTFTIQKIFSTGIQPQQNLYYRIPQFMKYKDEKKGKVKIDLNTTSDSDYEIKPNS